MKPYSLKRISFHPIIFSPVFYAVGLLKKLCNGCTGAVGLFNNTSKHSFHNHREARACRHVYEAKKTGYPDFRPPM